MWSNLVKMSFSKAPHLAISLGYLYWRIYFLIFPICLFKYFYVLKLSDNFSEAY
jgi:hypothetical protein